MGVLTLISLGLLGYITYALFQPINKNRVEKKVVKTSPSIQQPNFPSLFVVGLTVRKDTVSVLLPCFPPTQISLPNLLVGGTRDYSYLVIKENGSITQFKTEDEAQKDFMHNSKNYGIVLLIFEPDRIVTKDVCPTGRTDEYINQITISLGIGTTNGK